MSLVHITAIKRHDGRRVEGTANDDGLQDLWALTTDDGEVVYVSSLDTIENWEPVTI